jgi:hypothetical protein
LLVLEEEKESCREEGEKPVVATPVVGMEMG